MDAVGVVVRRLSTIRDADKIVVMREGEIVEEGTHDELAAKEDGLYKDMWEKQSMIDAGVRVVE